MTTPKINSKKLTSAWHLTDTPDLMKDAQDGRYFPNSEAYPKSAPAGSSTNAGAMLGLQWKLS